MTEQEKLREIGLAYFDNLILPPPIPLSQWAAETRRLSSEASAERGKWHNRPFQAEMLDALSPHAPQQQVVLMLASQLTKTECIVNFLGYIIHRDPGPVLIVEPREVDARALSKDRITPMIRDTPELAERIFRKATGRSNAVRGLEQKARTAAMGSTTLHMKFVGGHVSFAGSHSPAGLAMRPIRYLMLDEVDRYPASAGNEGDPVMLAMRRTDEFQWNKKILICSTPTIEGYSRIARIYEDSDQRRPLVPCPMCAEYQELDFYRLKWDGDPQNAYYLCLHCQQKIPHFRKGWMLSQGKWKITKPGSPIAGFWLSQMYSTRRSWPEIAAEFEIARKNTDTLRVFVNTVLAQTWKEQGEAPDWKILYERAENYSLQRVMPGALFLTAGVDVQEDRLEVMVVGWGRNKESWLVDYIVIEGSVRQQAPITLPDGTKLPPVWDRLTEVLGMKWASALPNRKPLPIQILAIDSGWASQEVYDWARRHNPQDVMVVRGLDTATNRNVLLGSALSIDVNFHGKKVKSGMRVWPINTSFGKRQLYAWLKLEKPTEESGDPFPPNYVHIPHMNEEFFRQLTAEVYETHVDRKGYRKYQWVKHYSRNEALDTFIYAWSAAARYGLERFGNRDWDRHERSLLLSEEELSTIATAGTEEKPAVPPVPVQKVSNPNKRRRGMYTPQWSTSDW